MARRQYTNEPAPYELSRSALRERYGSRRIDASAPQSPLDSTPSGRNRRAMMDNGGDVAKAAATEENQFQNQFQPRPWSLTAPIGNPMPVSNPGVPQSNNQLGTPLPGFPPYGAVSPAPDQPPPISPLAFNLSQPSPIGANIISQYAPKQSTAAYVPPWRKPQQTGYMASLLDSAASKWLV